MIPNSAFQLPVIPLGPCPYGQTSPFQAAVLPEAAFPHREPQLIGALLRQGFRRNGAHWYRPACENCQACVPLRVDVTQHQPRRDQRRCLQRNRDLRVCWHDRSCDEEREELYRRYQQAVHQEAGAHANELHLSGSSPGGELEARDGNGRLLAVSILDIGDDGLSSVYCYWHPDQAWRGLGTYMILREIQRCRELGLPWLYLGYSVEGCRKMTYKRRFGPQQALIAGSWRGPLP
ncbi:MAG: arginyltransferase [Planctomycetota bacterium]|nr:MAG: arginyltransferase [Planctomycetota bacterium]